MFDPKIAYNDLPLLDNNFDQSKFLSPLIAANQAIAKLDWLTLILPNYEILIHPLLAKESIASNQIENINTTMVDFLQQEAMWTNKLSWAEKEVEYYRQAIKYWVEQIEVLWWITTKLLIELQSMIEPNKVWIRKIPWTVIANSLWQISYTPPVWEDNIKKLLYDLEKYMNIEDNIDPLVKVAIIHHQFESIHPFYDGNGRIWRILIILYLILAKKINKPILFLSSYIFENRNKYYQSFRRENKWFDEIILYILDGICLQSQITQSKILNIHHLMTNNIWFIKSTNIKDYANIANILFSYPFMTVQSFADHLKVSRQSASDIIKKLETYKLIKTTKLKNSKLIYIPEFINLLS